MSSFIVSYEAINRILSSPELRKSLIQETRDRTSKQFPDFTELGRKMLCFNTDATNYRYQETTETGERSQEQNTYIDSYVFNPVEVSRYQALKSLRCWLYQCLEGDYPEKQFYKKFDSLAGDLAYLIVADMPEYEKAEWG